MDRLAKANELYDDGKIDEAYALLGVKELDGMIHDILRLPADEREEKAMDIIDAQLLAISILEDKDEEDEGKYNWEIDKRYRSICKLVDKYHIFEDCLYDYIEFLRKNDQKDKAIEICNLLEKHFLEDYWNNSKELIKLYDYKGELLISDMEEAGKCFKLALFIYDNELKGAEKKEILGEAVCLYKNISSYYYHVERDELCEKYLKLYVSSLEKYFKRGSKSDDSRLLSGYDLAGTVSKKIRKNDFAAKICDKAFAIGEKYPDDEIMQLKMTGFYLTKARIAYEEMKDDEVLKLCEKGMPCVDKLLSKESNNSVLKRCQASFYFLKGEALFARKEYDEAQKNLLIAEISYEKIFNEEGEIVAKDLTKIYNAMGVLFERKNDIENAEKYYLLGYEFSKKLVGIDTDFAIESIFSLITIANFYYDYKEYAKAKPYFDEIMTFLLHAKDMSIDDGNTKSEGAKSYCLKLSEICKQLGQTEEAKKWKETAKEF